MPGTQEDEPPPVLLPLERGGLKEEVVHWLQQIGVSCCRLCRAHRHRRVNRAKQQMFSLTVPQLQDDK